MGGEAMNKRLITALAALALGGLIIFTVGITVSTVNTKDKNQNLAVPTAECSTVPAVSTPAKEAPAGMQSLALKRKIVRQRNAQHAKDEHITVPQAKSQKAKQLLDKVLAGRKMSSLEAENYNKTPVEIQELTYEQAHQREEYYRGLMEKDPSGKTEQGAKSGELYVLYRDYAMSIATGEPLAQMNYNRLRQSAEVIIRWNSDLEAGVGSSISSAAKRDMGILCNKMLDIVKQHMEKGETDTALRELELIEEFFHCESSYYNNFGSIKPEYDALEQRLEAGESIESVLYLPD
jgi:hypothetical protein